MTRIYAAAIRHGDQHVFAHSDRALELPRALPLQGWRRAGHSHHYTAPLHAAGRRAKTGEVHAGRGLRLRDRAVRHLRARKAYEHMRDTLLAEMKAAMPLDGVLLGMHGGFRRRGL